MASAQHRLDLLEAFALRLGNKEETEEEGEDGDPPENPESSSLGQPGHLRCV